MMQDCANQIKLLMTNFDEFDIDPNIQKQSKEHFVFQKKPKKAPPPKKNTRSSKSTCICVVTVTDEHIIIISVIINNKHGIYELPHKLPNGLRLRILENQKILGQSENFIELQPCAHSSSQNENFFNNSKKLLKNRN